MGRRENIARHNDPVQGLHFAQNGRPIAAQIADSVESTMLLRRRLQV